MPLKIIKGDRAKLEREAVKAAARFDWDKMQLIRDRLKPQGQLRLISNEKKRDSTNSKLKAVEAFLNRIEE